MECRFCQKSFHKGEHLRRHERCHTGVKPYVCKTCKRSFSRQDSLLRHEKLHNRGATTSLPSPEDSTTPQSEARTSLGVPTPIITDYISPPLSNASENQNIPTIDSTTPVPYHNTDPVFSAPPGDTLQTADLDFQLVWPDAADLFQTLISQDTSLQWQMPMGAFPYSPEASLADSLNTNFATPSTLEDRISSIDILPAGGNDQALREVRNMVASSSNSVNAAIDGTGINEVFLDESLHMFFARFIPTFPILHRGTFVFRDCIHPLLLNAIAIGSLYLGPKASIAKGEALWKLAQTAVATSWPILITHQGPYDAGEGVQLVITALLSQVYGALSKNRTVRMTSQATRSLSFSWARRCGMFDNNAYLQDLPNLIHESETEKDHQWRLWVGREIKHRALLAHYMVDGLIAQMTGEPTSVRHAANQLGIPIHDCAFEANTADEWISALQLEPCPPSSPTFRTIIHTLFTPQSSITSYLFSAFSLRVTLEGIQSILSECGNESEEIIGVPSRKQVRSALSRMYPLITQSTSLSVAERLETLLRWHAICLDAIVDTSSLCRELCARWNVEQHVWNTARTISLSTNDKVSTWSGTEDARRALLHAVAIQDIVETLPRGRAHVIHMPASLLSASTVYAVLALTGIVTVKLVNDPDFRFVIDDHHHSDLTDPIIASSPTVINNNNNHNDNNNNNNLSTWQTKQYIQNDRGNSSAYLGPTRNLVYELNSMHKLMGCLKTQWGIASDMEAVIEQWVTLCH